MTTNWDAEAVLAASNAWAWVPEEAPRVQTEEYVVVACPDWFLTPTSARVFGSERDAIELADEICDTSAPILRRLGFTRHGEERTLVLDLS